MYDLIIIGADMAGLTAGIYAGRKKIKALILTRKVGGQSPLAFGVENYPGFLKIAGAELLAKTKEQAEGFGIPIKEGEEVVSLSQKDNLFSVKTGDGTEYEAKTILVATGGKWRSLNVPGEAEFMGRGVSICAVCDAPFFQNKRVAVVGGGNSAFNSACDLLRYADKVYLLQHRKEFVGDKSVRDFLEKSGKVEFLVNAETREIRGEKTVNALIYEDLEGGGLKELKVDGVFVDIGRLPSSSLVEGFLELNNRKEIVIDGHNSTSVKGVFAAGDVTSIRYKQLIIAAGEGAKAALAACEYLNVLVG